MCILNLRKTAKIFLKVGQNNQVNSEDKNGTIKNTQNIPKQVEKKGKKKQLPNGTDRKQPANGEFKFNAISSQF